MIETVIISAVASIGMRLLAASLEKSPKQDINQDLPDSSYRKSIPRTYNYFRQDVNWVEPFGEDQVFFKKERGKKREKRDVLFGRFLGVVSNSHTDHIAIWVNGKGRSNIQHTDPTSLQASLNFVRTNIIWLDGNYDQLGWANGNLKIANLAYYQQLKNTTGKNYDSNNTVGHRGLSCIGFTDLDLSEDIKTSTLPTVSVLNKTKTVYDVAAIVTNICADANILSSEINVSELSGVACMGFSRPQNGQNYAEAIAQLGLAYKFFATETNQGTLNFRKFERPGVTLSLKWEELIPLEDNRLWSEEQVDPVELPKTINLTFYDPATDYLQNSVISDEYPEAQNQNEDGMDIPVVMTEETAKELANWHLNQLWIRSKTYQYKLSFSHLGKFIVGDVIVLPGNIYTQVQNYTVGADYTIDVDAVRYDPRSNTSVSYVNNNSSGTSTTTPSTTSPIDSNSYTPEGSVNYGTLKLLDLPLADSSHSELGFYALSDRAQSVLHLDKGIGLFEELTFAKASTFGSCNTTLASVTNSNLKTANLPIVDPTNTLQVTLVSGGLLTAITDTEFTNQERIAFVGRYANGKWQGEYIGFQYADFMGANKYELQNLQRGLNGTESYINKHVAGEEFFLLVGEEAYWERVIYQQRDINATFTGKLAVVPNQDLAATPVVSIPLSGQSLAPLPPVDVEITQDPEGNLVFSFTTRYRSVDRKTGEDSDSFQIDLLNSSSAVVRTLSGSQPIIYPQAQKTADGLDSAALNANIYKVSSIVNRGYSGLIRNLGVASTSNTVITAAPNSQTKGFKYISSAHTVATGDDSYWLLVDTTLADINITLPDISSIKFWVQNIGTNQVTLTGNLKAVDTVLRQNEAIFLLNRTSVWYGQISGRINIPQHLIVNANVTLSQTHHNKIVSIQSATTVTVTLDETVIVNPKNFHTTIRKKGDGDVKFVTKTGSSSVIESTGTTLATKYRAAYVGYEGNGVWILLGDLQ